MSDGLVRLAARVDPIAIDFRQGLTSSVSNLNGFRVNVRANKDFPTR